MSSPTVISNAADIRQQVLALRSSGQRVGLVPTMGALHAGHVSLVEAARQECESVVTTIFVNPTQFGPGEDLDRYPRNLSKDLELLGQAGCDLVFVPDVQTMYPDRCETLIDVGSVSRPFEGEHRPGHFAGVATVVMKLMQLAPADLAYFGQKDYQQILVIKQMVADLNVPVELRICPTVRESDGLAMSSRNAYLSRDDRQRALSLSSGLNAAKELFGDGERDAQALRQAVVGQLAAHNVAAEYVAIVAEGTVAPVESVDSPAVILIAARVGQTRLIDNAVLQ